MRRRHGEAHDDHAVGARTRAARSRSRPETAVGQPFRGRAAGRDRPALPVGPGEDGLGQQLLRHGRPGRHLELEGPVLRIARPGQRRHRGQTAVLAVGHGAVRPDLRLLQLEPARAERARRGRVRGAALPRRAAAFRARRRPARGRRARADAGCRAHVPLRQPRRLPRAAARRRRLLRRARARTRQHDVAGARRGRDRVRLPRQDAAGVPRPARLRAGVRRRGADVARAPDRSALRRGRGRGRLGGLVDRGRRAVAGRRPAVHQRFDRQHRAGTGFRLQRPRPDLRRGPAVAAGRPPHRPAPAAAASVASAVKPA